MVLQGRGVSATNHPAAALSQSAIGGMLRRVIVCRFGLLSLPLPNARHHSVNAVGFGQQDLPSWTLGNIFVHYRIYDLAFYFGLKCSGDMVIELTEHSLR